MSARMRRSLRRRTASRSWSAWRLIQKDALVPRYRSDAVRCPALRKHRAGMGEAGIDVLCSSTGAQ